MKEETREDWCPHIHWWGNDYYFVDTYDPFRVSEKHSYWRKCPICDTPRPPSNITWGWSDERSEIMRKCRRCGKEMGKHEAMFGYCKECQEEVKRPNPKENPNEYEDMRNY